MAWGAIGGAVAGAVISGSMSGGSSGGGGGGQGYYVPQGLNAADNAWQNYLSQSQGIPGQAYGAANPLLSQYLSGMQGINYSPYQQAANTAGTQYGGLANLAGQQGNIYGMQAGLAGQQQQGLYGAANQIWNTAQDPQQALYNQTLQQLQDQVRAGQAARGLGVSPVGASLENQALSNFNIDWQNQQLARQAQAAHAMGGLSNAGGIQGQLVGANLAGQLGVMGQQPGFTQQSAQVPLSAQQYIAGQPLNVANQYAQGLGGLQALYGNAMGQTIPYMNYGQGAQQAAYGNLVNQNAANAQMWGNIGSAVAPSVANWLGGSSGPTWGSPQQSTYGGGTDWLNNTFGAGTAPSYSTSYWGG